MKDKNNNNKDITYISNNTIKIISKRRSIRKFRSQDVAEDLIKKILEAGRQAPSAGNRQPWRFIVIRNRTTINEVTDTTYIGADRKHSKNQDWIRTAPVLIVICTDNRETVDRYGEMGKRASLLDTGAAIENMLLAIASLGLASCWVGGFRTKELKEVLAIPDEVEATAFLPIGYSDDNSQPRGRKNIEEILFYEQYGNKNK